MKVIRDLEVAGNITTGTSLSGYVDATYKQLVAILGEPTYSSASGDDKVQKEWVVEFEGNVFTVYDWKTYDAEYTMNELNRFNVGSKAYALDFIEALEKQIADGI